MIYLILVVGLILRLISLNQSLWLDEATSAIASQMNLQNFFGSFMKGDFHPPLYYLLLKYWTIIFGNSEIALRLPSVIFGIGSVYMVYLIGHDLYNKKVATISALLLATSCLSIYYSQEARMYGMASFLVIYLVYSYIKKRWTTFAILLPIIAMTDYVSLFILPVFWILERKNLKQLVIANIPLIVTFLFWLPFFKTQLFGGLAQSGTAWWNLLGIPTLKNALLIPIKFFLGRIAFDNRFIYSLILLFALSVYGFVILRRPLRGEPYKVIWFWLGVPILIGIAFSFKIPTLSYFRFLFCLPALYLLAAAGVEKIGKHRTLFIGILLFINVASSLLYLLNPRFQREDWRAAAETIGKEQIILPSSSQQEALVYYKKGGQITDYPTDGQIWLSRYVWEIVDPDDSVRVNIESMSYNKAGEYNFNGVVFWKYTKSLYAYRN